MYRSSRSATDGPVDGPAPAVSMSVSSLKKLAIPEGVRAKAGMSWNETSRGENGEGEGFLEERTELLPGPSPLGLMNGGVECFREWPLVVMPLILTDTPLTPPSSTGTGGSRRSLRSVMFLSNLFAFSRRRLTHCRR